MREYIGQGRASGHYRERDRDTSMSHKRAEVTFGETENPSYGEAHQDHVQRTPVPISNGAPQPDQCEDDCGRP